MLAQGTVMLYLYYYVFLMSSYFLKMFLLAMFGKLIVVLLESSLCFETAVKQFKTPQRRSEEKLQKPEDTQRCFNVIRQLMHILMMIY